MRRLLALALTAFPLGALAGAFGVSPIRIDLDPGARSGLVTVTNDDERKLHFQLKLFEWTQSPTGDDQLADSEELIFFPQLFTVDPKQKRIIRVGVRAPYAGPERAFRLFIEELPDPEATPGSGAQVAVRLRFGVPIFLSAGKVESAPDIATVDTAKGALRVVIRNAGSRQIRFEEVSVRAGDRIVAKAAGWYVFPGVARTFLLPVTSQDCPLPKSVEIHAVGEGKDVRKTVELPGGACPP